MPCTRQSEPLLTQTASEKFNLIDLIPKYDGSESLGIRRFLEKINDVANLGKWSNAEKDTILKLNLAGIAEEFFYPTQPTSRFISGLRNDIRRFVLARDPNNLEESINAALIEEQNVKLNQIAIDERTGLSPLQTETSVISALTNKLEEINLRVERLQEASSVTSRKTGEGLFRRRETVLKCFYCDFEGHKQAECRKRRAEERTLNYQPPWGNAVGDFSVFRQPNTHSFDQRRVHFHDSTFRIITQPPGFRQTFRKELPVIEEM
ncbi:hypothetical protein TNCV_2182901 [Trichonephila clavipes]|uniref:CCHC-type domain-containing protein n=1 Tax=Trichonephila clavipes TaxID=2585209 RepID=A0A8X7B9G2_TRICX|nr:hypothetical protein TNCV_2182901 [Trichonephila clavipes]